MPTAAQLHSRRAGSVTGSAPSLSASASAASWASVTAPSALGRGSDVLEVRCTVQFKYAAPAFPALFVVPTPATVQLVTAAPSSPSSSSKRPSEAGLWVQPAGHAARLPSRTDGGDVAAVQPQFSDVAHYNRLPTRPSHGDVYLGPTTTARPSTVRAVRRQVPAQLLQHQATSRSFWLPLSAVTALHWHTRDEEDGVAPSRGSAASSGSSSGGGGSVSRVVVVLQCAGGGLGHAVSVPSVVRLDGLRYSDALALADAYDSVAESAPIPTNNNGALVSRPEDQPMLRHNTPPIADAARGGAGKQVGAALIDAFPSPLAVHVDPASNTPGSASTACSSPASPLAHDRCDETGLPAAGHVKSAAYATYARLLGGQAAWTDTTTRCTAPVRAANGTWGNHQDDDDDDQCPTRNHTAPQSPTANPAAGHLFHSVASFGDSTMTLPDSSQATSALYSPLGIPRQESSCAAWSSQPRPSPEDDRLLSGAPPATWSSGAITRAGLPFAAGETSRHVPRWFPPPPDDVSDVSESTVCSSRGTTPVGEPSVPSSALPATPLHIDSAGRHFATPHSRAAVTTSAPHAVPMTAPTPLLAATTPSAASAPPTGTLHWSPPPPQQQQRPPSLLPAPPVSQDRVLGSLQCLTAEQRQLVDFDRLLRPTIPPPADASTSAFSVPTNGSPSSTGAPPPVSQPQADLEQFLLRLRSYSLSRYSLAPADEVNSPLTAAGATESASLSLAGNDNDDIVSRFTLAAPVAFAPLTDAVVPAQLQPAAPLPRRGTSPLGAGHGVPVPAVNAPPVGGAVPHRAHGPFAQPQQHPAALFLAQGGLRGPSVSARPMRHGTVPHLPHPLHPPNLDSALVAEAVPNALVEGDCVDDRYAAAETHLSGSSGGSVEAAAVTPRQGRSGTVRTRRGSGTRPPQTPPRMLPRRPEPAKGPQPLALDGGAPLVRTPNDEEGSVPSPTAMAT